MQRLRQLSPWLAFSPWMVVVCAILLSGFVIYTGYENARRERVYMVRLMEGKGSALIGTLEAVLRTGMGFHWTDEELDDVLVKTGQQPDVRHMFIVGPDGEVLAASDPQLAGKPFFSPEELQTFSPDATVRHVLKGDVLWVYRELVVPKFDERMRGHGRGMGRGMGGRGMMMSRRGMMPPPAVQEGHHGEADAQAQPPERPLLAMVAFDASPMLAAMKADMSHTQIIGAVLLFLAGVGGLTWYLVRAYRLSRRMVQETTAFASNVIRTLPVGIIATDTEGRITSVNPESVRIVGRDCTGEPLAHALPELWPPLAEAMTHRAGVRELEIRCTTGERRVPLWFSASPIVPEEGELLGYALIVRDLGEIRRLQAELRHSERLAALGNLAAGIAHEIRNPLGAIKGLARFFEEASDPDGEEARVAAIMTREVGRLDRVVGDLLDFARPDVLNRTSVAPKALVERVRRLMAADLDHQGVEFVLQEKSEDGGPVPEVCVDGDRITQVLLNLCLNAVQAMGQNENDERLPRLEVEIRSDGEWVALSVTDNGTGMTAETLKNIFSPYFTTKAHGSGLGLSIAHKIAEAHGGRLEARSTPGMGSTFILVLPLESAHVAENSGC